MSLVLDLLWGSVAGFLAAIVMTLVELPFWERLGIEGVAEWQINWVMVSQMNKKWKAISKPKLSWTLASHLSHGVAAGIVFGLLFPIFLFFSRLPDVSALWIGLVYGVGLWILFAYSGRRTFESVGKIRITNRALLGALLSDSVYGFVLGLLIWIVIYSKP